MRVLRHLTFLLCVFSFVSPRLFAPPVPDAGWMFDPAVVVDVNLIIPEASMAQIPVDMNAERPYVPATFTMTYTGVSGVVEKTYGPWAVTLKVKGMYGSFRALPYGEKAGLKIKFPSGRRPDGLKKFTLNNMVQDGTMVHEALSYEVFRAMDVAAPRTGYARVTINGVYFGIYLNLETPDTVSLPRWFPTTGHLYEGSYGGWWGDVGDPFSGHYEVDEGNADDRTDLQNLINAARSPAKGWFARMYPVADLEQMTRMWACEWFTGHWDGYSQFITNNYYLHSDATGRFCMLPWGTDQTFTWAERYDPSGDHFIFNNCIRDPIGRAMYTDALQEVAKKWVQLNLEQRADAAYASVSAESWGVHDVKWFISNRLAEHRAWVALLPRPPRQIETEVRRTGRPGRIDVTWSDSPSSNLKGYAVEYRTSTTPWTRIEVESKQPVFLERLEPGTYTIRVRSMNKFGNSLPVTTTVKVN